MARLFVAAEVPDEVRADLQARVPRPDEPGVRWVPPTQWHVTLRFLGEADPDVVQAALAPLDAPVASVRLGPRVSRLGRSVVCLPAHGLDEVAAAVRALTAELGDPPERRFAGHLTLGRLRHRGACGVAGSPYRAVFPVTEVALVESTLGPGGARHRVLAHLPLRPHGSGPDPARAGRGSGDTR